MRLAKLLFSFKGVIDRRTYALVAWPILIIFEISDLAVVHADLWLGQVAVMDAWPIAVVGGAPPFLLTPSLLAVSVKRLRDCAQSSLWVLPYLSPFIALMTPVLLIALGKVFLVRDVGWLQAAMGFSHWYGLALALVLALAPGRAQVEPARSAPSSTE